jgi:hypothetical protein
MNSFELLPARQGGTTALEIVFNVDTEYTMWTGEVSAKIDAER